MTVAPIALIAALRETSVLFAALFGMAPLREPVLPARIVAALFVLAGMALMRLDQAQRQGHRPAERRCEHPRSKAGRRSAEKGDPHTCGHGVVVTALAKGERRYEAWRNKTRERGPAPPSKFRRSGLRRPKCADANPCLPQRGSGKQRSASPWRAAGASLRFLRFRLDDRASPKLARRLSIVVFCLGCTEKAHASVASRQHGARHRRVADGHPRLGVRRGPATGHGPR